MCRHRTKFFVLFVFGIFFSCGFMDLRPLAVETVPGKPDTVLPDLHTPVSVIFGAEMECLETERLFSVRYSGGKVEGDLRWQGNALYFYPRAGWSAGTRYTLSLSGMAYARDGRELRLEKHVPFFALSRSAAPYVVSFEPEDGASVGIVPEQGGRLRLVFSVPMDKRSVEEGLKLEGTGETVFTWLEDDHVVEAGFAKPLSAWTVYRWTLSKARSRDGVPLAKSASGQFTTDADRRLPQVLRAFPMMFPSGSSSGPVWLETALDLETGLGPSQGIGIEFNKPMDRDSVLRAVRFEPSLAGRTERLSESSIIFIPEKDPDIEITYTMIISADTRDAFGLKMGTDYTVNFIPDISFLRLVSLSISDLPLLTGDDLVSGLSRRTPLDISSGLSGGGVLRFSVSFSHPFSQEAKMEILSGINLAPFFPGTLSPVALRSAEWPSDDTLDMVWEGLRPGDTRVPHFYRLSVSGGKSGINNGDGSYLKDPWTVYLEAVHP